MLERVITALVPRVFTFLLLDELVDSLGCEGTSRPLLARRNGPEPFPGIGIQTDGHGDCAGGHGLMSGWLLHTAKYRHSLHEAGKSISLIRIVRSA